MAESWIDMPADSSTQWARAEFINQFIDAVNLRLQVANASWQRMIARVEEGDDVQRSFSISRLQRGIEYAIQRYVNPAWVDFGQPELDLDGWLWTLENFWEHAGLHPDGWSRTQVHPDDPMFEGFEHSKVADHGGHRRGDYIGPWLWNELKAAIELMTCRVYFRDNVEHNVHPRHGGMDSWNGEDWRVGAAKSGLWGEDHVTRWKEAFDMAECRFAGGSRDACGMTMHNFPTTGTPRVHNGTTISFTTATSPGHNVRIGRMARKWAIHVTANNRTPYSMQELMSHVTAHYDVYLLATIPSWDAEHAVFDSFGEPVTLNQWSLYHASTLRPGNVWSGSQDQWTTATMGSHSLPPRIDQSLWPRVGQNDHHWVTQGWRVGWFQRVDQTFGDYVAEAMVVCFDFTSPPPTVTTSELTEHTTPVTPTTPPTPTPGPTSSPTSAPPTPTSTPLTPPGTTTPLTPTPTETPFPTTTPEVTPTATPASSPVTSPPLTPTPTETPAPTTAPATPTATPPLTPTPTGTPAPTTTPLPTPTQTPTPTVTPTATVTPITTPDQSVQCLYHTGWEIGDDADPPPPPPPISVTLTTAATADVQCLYNHGFEDQAIQCLFNEGFEPRDVQCLFDGAALPQQQCLYNGLEPPQQQCLFDEGAT